MTISLPHVGETFLLEKPLGSYQLGSPAPFGCPGSPAWLPRALPEREEAERIGL